MRTCQFGDVGRGHRSQICFNEKRQIPLKVVWDVFGHARSAPMADRPQAQLDL